MKAFRPSATGLMGNFYDVVIPHVELPHSAAPRSLMPDVNPTALTMVRQTTA